MSHISDKLEKQADTLFNNIAGWETNALKRIGRRVKEIKSLSYADLQAINNATIIKQDVNAILDELAVLTGQNAREVKHIYSDMIEQQHEENKVLYDYRNKPFIPFADNKELQAIVMAYARTTAETMVNLSMTKARQLGMVDSSGKFIPIKKSFIDILDKAVMSAATGTGDFGSEMRGVLKELGGSGLRIDYGGGVTRRLDTMVRQNLLWGAKQASVEYNEMIGEELGCDGIEIDWHSCPRPSHEFMQGKQYSMRGKKTINGITYESAEKALDALQDYGCLHFKTPIILGVSEPTYSPEELKRLNEQNKRTFEIDGKQMTGYECKQGMRRLEVEAKKTKEQIELLRASGDNVGVSQLNQKLNAIEDKYNQIAEASGIKPQPQRMAIVKEPKAAANAAIRNTGKVLQFNPSAKFDVKLDSLDDVVNESISRAARKVAEQGGEKCIECLSLIDIKTGEEVFFEEGNGHSVGSRKFWDFVRNNTEKNFAFIHNHNTDGYFSETDMRTLLYMDNIKIFGAIRIDGVQYFAEKTQGLTKGVHFDDLLEEELKDLNYKSRNGIITGAERTRMREEIIVDNLLKRFTKGLVEIDGR